MGKRCAAGERQKDLAGMRSGRVTALGDSGQKRRGASLWLCRCDCGKEFLTEGYKISGGIIQSCGCARHAHQIKDLTGQRFGRLTALRRLDEKTGTGYAWLCRCDCGNETKVSANALLSGGTKSCGCGKIEALRRKARDIRGQRFGRLLALEPLERREAGSVVWRCRCDCGREAEVPYNSLASGNTKSCGCLLRENESPVKYQHYTEDTCVELLERRGLRRDNTSGCTGVIAYRGKWRAQITFQKKTYYLGVYGDREDAVKIRKQAEERIFGGFLDWYYSQFPQKE